VRDLRVQAVREQILLRPPLEPVHRHGQVHG
jgi:hypothetical protein